MVQTRIAALVGALAGAGAVALLSVTSPDVNAEPTDPGTEPRVLATPGRLDLRVETVASGLRSVWDMTWAPDGQMWFTERGGRVSRLDVRTGQVTVMGEVPGVTERG